MLGEPNFLGWGGVCGERGGLNWSESGVWVYFFNYNYEKVLTMGVDGCRLRIMNEIRPHGLTARISDFHSDDRGSIPRADTKSREL